MKTFALLRIRELTISKNSQKKGIKKDALHSKENLVLQYAHKMSLNS